MKRLRGRAWVFGHDLNTDVIHPPSFYSLDPEVVKRGLFHGLDPEIQPNLRPGDILVAGRNFGCGSSRETSIRSLLLNQIGAIIAVDFARIFFRNATNHGLPCLTFRDPSDVHKIVMRQEIDISLTKWTVATDTGIRVPLEPVGAFVQKIWAAGGLLAMLPPPQPVTIRTGSSRSGTRRRPELPVAAKPGNQRQDPLQIQARAKPTN